MSAQFPLCGDADKWIAYAFVGLQCCKPRFAREIAVSPCAQKQGLPNVGWKQLACGLLASPIMV
jgi:hypothetical protein